MQACRLYKNANICDQRRETLNTLVSRQYLYRLKSQREHRVGKEGVPEVHTVQGDLQRGLGPHVPRAERPLRQHLHIRRKKKGGS